MRPPRYLLREYAVNRLMEGMRPGKFLEYGYGNGNMLLNLSRRGYHGDGCDSSPDARGVAEGLLSRNRVANVRLVEQVDERERYDYIFAFEVVGYLEDAAAGLGAWSRQLRRGGKLVISVVKEGSAYSSSALGNQRFFTRAGIRDMVRGAGLRVTEIWNYGYPLANLLSPFLTLGFILWNVRLRGGPAYRVVEVGKTGLFHETPLMRALGLLVNPVTIWPFARLQLLFKDTDLGNGYLVVAEKA